MKTTPALQDIISYLIEKHEHTFYHTFTYSRLRLLIDEKPALPILNIYVYPHSVRVAQEVDLDGFITDPDITFSTVGGEWIPVCRTVSHRLFFGLGPVATVEHPYALPNRQDLSAWRQGLASEAKTISEGEEEQRELAHFCEEWAQKLEQQGWRGRAIRA